MEWIGMLIAWIAAVANISLAIYHWRFIRRGQQREAAHRDEIDARVRQTLDKLTVLPEWRQSIDVCAFLAWLASEQSGVAEHIRLEARRVLPLEDVLIVQYDSGKAKVH